MYENITTEKDSGILTVTLNRPKQYNALNEALLCELSDAIQQIEKDPHVRVVIVKGGGEKAFAAGADIAAMQDMAPEESLRFGAMGQRVFSSLEALRVPVIAMIQGFALGGGCELAMACDIRVASEKASFGQPEVGLGITPGFGGSQRLTRLVGRGIASLLLFTGKMISAEEALRIGLADMVVPHEELEQTVLELARKIMSNSSLAVEQTKKCIRHGLESGLEAGIAYEAQAFALCFSSEDRKNRMTSFLNRSKKS